MGYVFSNARVSPRHIHLSSGEECVYTMFEKTYLLLCILPHFSSTSHWQPWKYKRRLNRSNISSDLVFAHCIATREEDFYWTQEDLGSNIWVRTSAIRNLMWLFTHASGTPWWQHLQTCWPNLQSQWKLEKETQQSGSIVPLLATFIKRFHFSMVDFVVDVTNIADRRRGTYNLVRLNWADQMLNRHLTVLIKC